MIDIVKNKIRKHIKAQKRSKKNLKVEADKPRLVVNKTDKYLYMQIIDENDKILYALSSISKELKGKKLSKNIESAKELGHMMGKKLKSMKIERVAFDRNGIRYHGKIKALADACREEGIKF